MTSNLETPHKNKKKKNDTFRRKNRKVIYACKIFSPPPPPWHQILKPIRILVTTFYYLYKYTYTCSIYVQNINQIKGYFWNLIFSHFWPKNTFWNQNSINETILKPIKTAKWFLKPGLVSKSMLWFQWNHMKFNLGAVIVETGNRIYV